MVRISIEACSVEIFVICKHAGQALSERRDKGYSKDQRHLIRYLTNPKYHDTQVRPVYRAGEPINVTIRMNLYQIIDVEERSQSVVIYGKFL